MLHAPPPLKSFMAAPINLMSTLDQQQCNNHGGFAGGLACKAGLPNGMLALVWNYCKGCHADGFHLYRVDGGQHTPVSIPANGTSVTLALLDVPAGGFSGKCYVVTAYSGQAESGTSDAYCIGGGTVIATATFAPQHVRSSGKNANYDGIGSASTTQESLRRLKVGYYHSVTPVGALHNPAWDNWLWRGAAYFDVSSLKNKKIYSALLHLRVQTSYIYQRQGTSHTFDEKNVISDDHTTSCAAKIGTATSYWWTYSTWIAYSIVSSHGQYVGPDVAMDVTGIVRTWVGGAPNYGLVLAGETESTDPHLGADGANLNWLPTVCQTEYTNDISLEVKYSS
ncbi:MAG: hypothetical protein DLM53_01180 [Candidatus Eremiobacter antarcticus]|nr:MAG: hypothetical protein DLM53_01180 [Candidatus Eremiobacter sp. RRmetagenome_bin22]